jgi:hypothetical protein
VSEHRHGPTAPRSTTTVTFDYTGTAQSWTVPEGVTEAAFVVNGAAGGPDIQGATGLGGQAEATVTVPPGAAYTIVVGGAGQSILQAMKSGSGGRGGYGWGSGGAGGAPAGARTAIAGAGGGGGSAVLLGSDVLLVAGGGGGSSDNPGAGGAGGGAQGGAGQANISPDASVWNGQGGTQTAPGAGAVGVTASHGGPGVGHTGGAGGTGHAGSGGGGGGGGGWFGGGGGASGDLNVGAGGGASGYAAAWIAATLTSGVRNGNGQVTIAYAAPPAHPSPSAPMPHPNRPGRHNDR